MKQGFDFNKCFKEGISFVTRDIEDKQRNVIQERFALRRSALTENADNNGDEVSKPEQPMSIPEDQKEFMDK